MSKNESDGDALMIQTGQTAYLAIILSGALPLYDKRWRAPFPG